MRILDIAIMMVMLAPSGEGSEPAHAKNTVFAGVTTEGLKTHGVTVKLPQPRLRDGQDAERQRSALRDVAGSSPKLDEMVRDSVTAPYIIKVSDVKAGDATIRVVDVWFVVHADLAGIDPAREAAKTSDKETEAGNMAFRTRLLGPDELRKAGLKPPTATKDSTPETWFAHIHGRLLDRIAFDATNRVEATRTDESIVVAARMDPAFDKAGEFANGWKPIAGGKDDAGAAGGEMKPYAGGISYTKISRLAFQPRALLVEMHAAFVEPHEWFQGAPILRSKFSVVAQDQIRRLRRELARRRKP